MQIDTELISEEQSDALYERKIFTVDKGQEPFRIDKWVQMHMEGATRNKVQQGIEAGFLTVNGKTVKSNYKIKPGDEIILMSLINPEHTILKEEPIPLNIVYEDDFLMVLNKPPNMVVHPGVGNFSGTLLNGVAYYLRQQNPQLNEESLPRFGLVHRIDKNTTGLIVLAKTGEAAAHLAKQFFNHTVNRRYIALVWGNIQEEEGTINAHIARHKQHRKMFDAYPEGDTGKHAITHFKVLERFNYVTLVECKLETGRTHQIRVHMKHIGHTLFNDIEYGGDKILKGTIYSKYKQFVDNCFEACPRCALHAKTLGFIHPHTGKEIFFESPLPADMEAAIDKWRQYSKV
ncbi:MAG: RNA pseudouridine synthase [Sphingobacteriia bacterium 24-36-13]|jgi:23S rRNA pseudouridine1911/1915/1917 synthase|uniref:RluA family pseudouridine synthase n=1 Tax=Sediminibacterium sp. TaxID=1917865 RepID=UPI000BC44D14|nr:RluA family pseudouridine synthase [Sediminibacterium sp.]OYY09021.1 MAG: RNA pseudouridine synthase [Sphingobacteriia bacterium 35-36-14]OYZ55398.1 MAG: RNA pseudouridine synthase [Sphingobacteriia bacterium 24-36-13]OZA65248.1 MAG: RNA pseudouridine synthase [Sphingobacteriia bacterium 39-36-14]HQS22946.1 RluA family pseudouridine synthase [Sediminibacterium sp.]HQS34982.1 RluA family pseudouridine synthase [Sediminibacterium sp.]